MCTSSTIKSGGAVALTRPDTPCSEVINRMWGRCAKRRSINRTLPMLSSMYKTVADASTFVSDDAVTTGSVVAKLVEVVASGNSSQKVEPTPGALSTPSEPPIAPSISGERQPKPVPSILGLGIQSIEGREESFVQLGATPGPVSVTRSRRRSATLRWSG